VKVLAAQRLFWSETMLSTLATAMSTQFYNRALVYVVDREAA